MKTLDVYDDDGTAAAVGDLWQAVVDVYGRTGYPTSDTLTATVYDAAGVDAGATTEVTRVSHGRYLVSVTVPAAEGQYVVVVAGTDDVTRWRVLASDPFTALPTLADVKAVLGATASDQYGDTAISRALAEETQAQADACDIPAAGYPASLRKALIRRVQVNLALQSQPVTVSDGEGGAGRPIGMDPVVRQLERRYPRSPVG